MAMAVAETEADTGADTEADTEADTGADTTGADTTVSDTNVGDTGVVDAGAARATGERDGQVRRGIRIGLVAGLAAITCCVSPVVFVLLGVATAAQAVALGDILYYDYGWWFRGFGLAVAAVAVVVHLRRRRACTLRGTARHWRLLSALAVTGGATYAALFWFTKGLSIWFG